MKKERKKKLSFAQFFMMVVHLELFSATNIENKVPLVNHVSYEFNDLMHISTFDRFWVGHFFFRG